MVTALLIILVFMGISLFIIQDLYKAGLRNFKQFDWVRYWNTNQIRLITIFFSAIGILMLLFLLKEWMDAVVAQVIAILGGAGSVALSKGISKSATIVNKPTILSMMEGELGVTEIPGPKSNPRILKYAKDLGYNWYTNDDTPWCALIMGWAIWRSGREHTGSLTAKSYLSWGKPATEEDIPSGNVIAVFHRGRAGASTGHVGVVKSVSGNTISLVSGNHSNTVAIAPYKKDHRFLGYRKPLV